MSGYFQRTNKNIVLKIFQEDPIFKKSVKIRPVEEIINIQIFRPLAHLILLKIANKNIKPEQIVLIHTLLIILCSFLILYSNDLVLNFVIFVLLQLKTVLDNLDGQIARYKEIESTFGRYFDTMMDYLGNLSLFLSIGIKHSVLPFSLLSFFALTWVLSYDFNLERIFKDKQNLETKRTKENDKIDKKTKFLKNIYDFFLGFQDKSIEKIENVIFELISRKKDIQTAKNLFWNKRYLNVTANMGLSTQIFILGLLVLFGLEKIYLLIPFICLFTILILFVYRCYVVYKG